VLVLPVEEIFRFYKERVLLVAGCHIDKKYG